MERPEFSVNDPRTIVFKSLPGEAYIVINSEMMNKLTSSQREHMQVTVQMFVSTLFAGVYQESVDGSVSDVLNHLRYRMGQVMSSVVDGTITQEPEIVSPSPDIALREFSQEISSSFLKTQEGIEVAKQRIVIYVKTVQAIIDKIEELDTNPQSTEIVETVISGLTVGMTNLSNRMQGMDEALGIILGKPTKVPSDVEELVKYFGQETTKELD